jgi:hypothetical protein
MRLSRLISLFLPLFFFLQILHSLNILTTTILFFNRMLAILMVVPRGAYLANLVLKPSSVL